MKVNPRIKVLMAKYTNRINIFFACAFIITLASAYGDYYTKKKTYPNLPWYAMFFHVNPQPSWAYAAPFIK